MRAVVFDGCGDADVLRVEDGVDVPLISDYEVLIRVAATTVNRKDLWRRDGSYGPMGMKPYLGFECSGVIARVGRSVTEFKEGDEVCALLLRCGGYAEFVAVDPTYVLPAPTNLHLADAAALPCAASLVMHSFFFIDHLTEHDTVLIHGGAGGVGTLAIQVASQLGFRVFATAGTEKKRLLCQNLGAHHCFNYKVEDFSQRVNALTNGKGVRYILDPVGREFLDKNLRCICDGGSLTYIGFGDEWVWARLNFNKLVSKEIQITGVNIQTLHAEDQRALNQEIKERLWPLIESKAIMPHIGSRYDFDHVAEAHRLMEKYQHEGKILITPK